jgi:hypothetical protein
MVLEAPPSQEIHPPQVEVVAMYGTVEVIQTKVLEAVAVVLGEWVSQVLQMEAITIVEVQAVLV